MSRDWCSAAFLAALATGIIGCVCVLSLDQSALESGAVRGLAFGSIVQPHVACMAAHLRAFIPHECSAVHDLGWGVGRAD